MLKQIMLASLLLCSVLLITPVAYAYWVNQLESKWIIPVTYPATVTITSDEPDTVEQFVDNGGTDSNNTNDGGLATGSSDIHNSDIDNDFDLEDMGVGGSEVSNSDSNSSSNNNSSGNSSDNGNSDSSSNSSSSSDSSDGSSGGSDPS